MKNTIKIAALLGALSFSTASWAQEAGDLVIMRRPVAKPNLNALITPELFTRVALGASDTGSNRYAQRGNLALNVTEIGCKNNSTGAIKPPTAPCLALPSGPTVGTVLQVDSQMDPDLKAIYVAPTEFIKAIPHAADNAELLAALCSTNISINGQSWALSCDPQSVVNAYEWRIANLAAPSGNSYNTSISAGTVQLSVNARNCYATNSGSPANSSFCSSLTKGPFVGDIVETPAVFVQDLRTVYVDRNAISQLQNGSTSPSPSICSSSIAIGPDRQSWRISCDAPDAPANYERYVSSIGDSYYSGSPRYNNVDTSSTFSFVTITTACWNKAANTSAVSDKCSYLPAGANVYDRHDLPATYVKELREVYVNKADIDALLPRGGGVRLNNTNLQNSNDACVSNNAIVVVSTSAGVQNWKLRCGTPDSPANYERYASYIGDSYQNGQPRYGSSDTSSTFSFSTIGISCWNKVSNVSSVSDKCAYLTAGANVYDRHDLPATYVKELREVYVNKSDLEALIPRGGSIKLNNTILRSANGACITNNAIVVVSTSTGLQNWKLRCGTPDSPANYERYASYIGDSYQNGQPRYGSSDTSSTFSFSTIGISCWNKVSNVSSVSDKCAYLTAGANVYDRHDLPATYVKERREVYVNKADLEALIPRGGYIRLTNTNILNADDACVSNNAYVFVSGSTGLQSWKLRCGAP